MCENVISRETEARACDLVRWFTNRAPGKTRGRARAAPHGRGVEPPTTAPMTDTPEEPEPSTDVDLQETPVDGSLTLARFPPELLVLLAEALGNPLVLLVSKAHLSKAFCEAAGIAQATLTHADLHTWPGTVDDAFVAAVVSKYILLLTLSLRGCDKITDEAVMAVASGCPQLTTLDLRGCDQITNAAVVAVASRCPRLTIVAQPDWLPQHHRRGSPLAVASGCPLPTTLNLSRRFQLLFVRSYPLRKRPVGKRLALGASCRHGAVLAHL